MMVAPIEGHRAQIDDWEPILDMSRQPGRPREFDEDRVLDELLFLFWRKGYDNTSQQDMAEAAGISTSSLFNTFGTKPELFDKVLRRYIAYAEDGCAGLLVDEDGVAALHAWVDELERHIRSDHSVPDGCLMTMSMNELAGRDPDISGRAHQWREVVNGALRAAIERAQRRGELSGQQPAGQRASTLQAAQIGALSIARSAESLDEVMPVLDGMHALIDSWA